MSEAEGIARAVIGRLARDHPVLAKVASLKAKPAPPREATAAERYVAWQKSLDPAAAFEAMQIAARAMTDAMEVIQRRAAWQGADGDAAREYIANFAAIGTEALSFAEFLDVCGPALTR